MLPDEIAVVEMEKKVEQAAKQKNITLTDDNINVLYHLAPCCHPIPGDEVLAFRDENGCIVVHKIDCPEAKMQKAHHGKGLIAVTWDTAGANTYAQTIRLEGIDKIGVVIQMLYTITESFHINITDIRITAKDGLFSGTLELQVHGVLELEILFNQLKNIKEIKNIERVL